MSAETCPLPGCGHPKHVGKCKVEVFSPSDSYLPERCNCPGPAAEPPRRWMHNGGLGMEPHLEDDESCARFGCVECAPPDDETPTAPAEPQTSTPLFDRGSYVLATKYSDGDPADAWCCGYYLRPTEWGRHLVGDVDGGPGPNGFRFSGYSHIALLDKDLGNWLIANSEQLEKSPPGTINLWGLWEARKKFLEQDEPRQ